MEKSNPADTIQEILKSAYYDVVSVNIAVAQATNPSHQMTKEADEKFFSLLKSKLTQVDIEARREEREKYKPVLIEHLSSDSTGLTAIIKLPAQDCQVFVTLQELKQ